MTTHESIPRARRIINFLLAEECTNENIVRLLNYQFEDTFRVRQIADKAGFVTACVFELVTDSGVAIPIEKVPFSSIHAIRPNGSRTG